MNPRERGFLLLTSRLGNPDRRPLSTAQLRMLAQRAVNLSKRNEASDLTVTDLLRAGVESRIAEKTVRLLDDEFQLDAYLNRAKRMGCFPITRAGAVYPAFLRERLALEAPGCLWAKGNLKILSMPAVALVGSRDLNEKNRRFARQVGIQAARQGYALVSGNARGADTVGQDACLEARGYVVSVLADSLEEHLPDDHQLFLSEEDFDEPFSAFRALHRNRVIHTMGILTFVAQCALGKGGSWDGSVQNLQKRWSGLYCCRDGSDASIQLEQMGAFLIDVDALVDFEKLPRGQMSFMDL